MSDLRVERVKALPPQSSRKTATIYLVEDGTDSAFVEMHVVGNNVAATKRVPTKSDIQANANSLDDPGDLTLIFDNKLV